MSGSLPELLRLYEAPSASTGKRYYRGRLNGVRLVAFPVEASDGQDAHLRVCISNDAPGPSGKDPAATRPAAERQSLQAQERPGSRRHEGPARRPAAASDTRPPPFNDDLPF